MAETLGSLCDKLTIVKLKEWHTTDEQRLVSLAGQARQLQDEINNHVELAIQGKLGTERLAFPSNKVVGLNHQNLPGIFGTIGELFATLAHVNCELWHQQEKVYEFTAVPHSEKDAVVESLARLNLQRNQCIDQIDKRFVATLVSSAPKDSV